MRLTPGVNLAVTAVVGAVMIVWKASRPSALLVLAAASVLSCTVYLCIIATGTA
jgi:hypothetical protein